MNREMREVVKFNLFVGEDEDDSMVSSIVEVSNTMRIRYGGRWSVVAGDKNNYLSYVRPAKGKWAVFTYDDQLWQVYQHDCPSSYKSEEPSIQYASLSRPNVTFIKRTELDDKGKEQLLNVLQGSNEAGLVGQGRVTNIGQSLEYIFGGTWSVHSHTNSEIVDSVYGYNAIFNYEGHRWCVYKNSCRW